MGFRDDLDAAKLRSAELEGELQHARERIDELERELAGARPPEPAPQGEPPPARAEPGWSARRRWRATGIAAVALMLVVPSATFASIVALGFPAGTAGLAAFMSALGALAGLVVMARGPAKPEAAGRLIWAGVLVGLAVGGALGLLPPIAGGEVYDGGLEGLRRCERWRRDVPRAPRALSGVVESTDGIEGLAPGDACEVALAYDLSDQHDGCRLHCGLEVRCGSVEIPFSHADRCSVTGDTVTMRVRTSLGASRRTIDLRAGGTVSVSESDERIGGRPRSLVVRLARP